MASTGRQILPQNVTPKHYVLQLTTDLETQLFNGTVDVDIVVNQDSDSITVNALELDVHSASIDKVKAKSISYDEEMQTAKFAWDAVWKAGQKKTLRLVFDGKLNQNMAGFYRSTYQTKEGQSANLGVTQFEATDCRRAFPCWDEPALKATFDISLTTTKELVHLSNMQVKDETVQGPRKTTKFATTPIMSTYLVAWAMGDFEYVESNAFRSPVRTYTIPGFKEQGVYAAELGAKTLAFFEKVFGIEYPLPKMDFLAVPDFSAGAMENWGLVTYRNVALLLDEENISASGREQVAMVVQHELAHQWFGNLVTMDFWEGLWLNEGFATWMAMFAGNHFYPEWKLLESFVATDLQSGLQLDSLRNSHPIEVPVKRAAEINQIFDNISYSKGCCVLTMLAKYLGEESFLKGVSSYLKKHAYGNTKTDDLWEALSRESGKDVVRLMQTWTKKIGYPLITVTEKSGSLSVRQNRFLSAGDATSEEDQTLYVVPLGLKTMEKNGSIVLEDDLEGRENTIELGSDKMETFKLNADQYGFYRTCYTPERLEKIGQQATGSSGFFSVQDRTGLVADAGALAAAGYGKTSGFLALIQQWRMEEAYLVWSEMLSRIGNLQSTWMFEPQEIQDALNLFVRDLTATKAKALGWKFSKNEDHIMVQFKALLFGAAGNAGDPEVKKAAQDMFSRFVGGDKSAIWPDIKAQVFNIALKFGGEKEYNCVLDTCLHPQSDEEKFIALRALGAATDISLVKRTLEFSCSKEVRVQDFGMVLMGLRGHRTGVTEMWAWAKQNWNKITEMLPPALTMLGSVLAVIISGLTTMDYLQDVETFFKKQSTRGFDQSLEQSLEGLRAKQKWVQRDSSDVQSFLIQNGYLKK